MKAWVGHYILSHPFTVPPSPISSTVYYPWGVSVSLGHVCAIFIVLSSFWRGIKSVSWARSVNSNCSGYFSVSFISAIILLLNENQNLKLWKISQRKTTNLIAPTQEGKVKSLKYFFFVIFQKKFSVVVRCWNIVKVINSHYRLRVWSHFNEYRRDVAPQIFPRTRPSFHDKHYEYSTFVLMHHKIDPIWWTP